VPVSKKRKPKRRPSSAIRSSAPSSSTSLASGASPKKKLSRQQIIIYVISIAMILSLAISYLIGNNSNPVPVATPTLGGVETPAPANSATEEAQPSPTTEPTTEAN
jgi:hypothetical protein